MIERRRSVRRRTDRPNQRLAHSRGLGLDNLFLGGRCPVRKSPALLSVLIEVAARGGSYVDALVHRIRRPFAAPPAISSTPRAETHRLARPTAGRNSLRTGADFRYRADHQSAVAVARAP